MFDDGSARGVLEGIMKGEGERAGGQIRKEDLFIKEKLRQEGIIISETMERRLLLLAMRRTDLPLKGRVQYKELEGHSDPLESHSYDCVEISKVLGLAAKEDLVTKDAEVAALFHDIGKTGPNDADEETQQLIIMLYSFDYPVVASEMTLGEFVEKFLGETLEESSKEGLRYQKALAKLGQVKIKGRPISADTKMIDFFRAHAEWGSGVLAVEPNISALIKFIAINHHAVRYGKMVELNGFQANPDQVKAAFWLEVVDYYQAAKRRRKRTAHEEIVEGMRAEFIDKLKQPKYSLQKEEFEKILQHLTNTYLSVKERK